MSPKGTARRLADDMIAKLAAGLKPAEFMQKLSRKYPDADQATVKRAFDIALSDIEERARAHEAEAEALTALHSMMDPDDPSVTVEGALRDAAAKGDKNAKALLEEIYGVKSRLFWALATAAAAKHPDWYVNADGTGIGLSSGSPGPENAVENLIDWYQRHHAAEASALETAIRGART